MTLKLENLRDFIEEIKKTYSKEITDQTMNKYIAEKFGISDYIMINIKKKLAEYGFIKHNRMGVWEICITEKEY